MPFGGPATAKHISISRDKDDREWVTTVDARKVLVGNIGASCEGDPVDLLVASRMDSNHCIVQNGRHRAHGERNRHCCVNALRNALVGCPSAASVWEELRHTTGPFMQSLAVLSSTLRTANGNASPFASRLLIGGGFELITSATFRPNVDDNGKRLLAYVLAAVVAEGRRFVAMAGTNHAVGFFNGHVFVGDPRFPLSYEATPLNYAAIAERLDVPPRSLVLVYEVVVTAAQSAEAKQAKKAERRQRRRGKKRKAGGGGGVKT